MKCNAHHNQYAHHYNIWWSSMKALTMDREVLAMDLEAPALEITKMFVVLYMNAVSLK